MMNTLKPKHFCGKTFCTINFCEKKFLRGNFQRIKFWRRKISPNIFADIFSAEIFGIAIFSSLQNNLSPWRAVLETHPKLIRDLFCTILTCWEPISPIELWGEFKDDMAQDILHQHRQIVNNEESDFNDDIYNNYLVQIAQDKLKTTFTYWWWSSTY